jgi:hypothetical protein
MEKKSWDVAKVRCFNCVELGTLPRIVKKIKHDWAQGGFVAMESVAKLGPNLIMFKFKVGINRVLCLLDLGTMHSFVSPNVVRQFKWEATKVAKPIKVHLA